MGQSQATDATTSLTVSNNAIVDARNGGIKALKISETLPTPTPTGNNSSGIVFDGSTGTVYGTVALQNDLTIGAGETLTIGKDASLTVPDGKTLTNNGTINNSGTLTNNGTVTNNGTLNVNEGGNLGGTPTGRQRHSRERPRHHRPARRHDCDRGTDRQLYRDRHRRKPDLSVAAKH